MKYIVALSGGKDSTAMALRLAEAEPRDYIYVITPTGNELPEMFAHWRNLSHILGKPIKPILAGNKSLQSLIREQRMLPNHRARWCTRKLKLEPYYKWLTTQTPCISFVGLRADEESRPGMIFPDANGIKMRFPMRDWGWGLCDVKKYLKEKGIEIPRRTDCAMCFWNKLGEWYLLWKENPEFYAEAEAEALEEYVSEKRGKPYTLRSSKRDSWPAALKDLRKAFENGGVPKRSLDQIERERFIGGCRVCTL